MIIADIMNELVLIVLLYASSIVSIHDLYIPLQGDWGYCDLELKAK